MWHPGLLRCQLGNLEVVTRFFFFNQSASVNKKMISRGKKGGRPGRRSRYSASAAFVAVPSELSRKIWSLNSNAGCWFGEQHCFPSQLTFFSWNFVAFFHAEWVMSNRIWLGCFCFSGNYLKKKKKIHQHILMFFFFLIKCFFSTD